jgi:hypothetical protein
MSETFKINGEIKEIYETVTFDSGFQKREFVVTIDGDTDYPQHVKLEIIKDKCAILDQFNEGQNVDVSFNLRGNEYKGKYYVNLQAWRIESDEIPQQASAPAGLPNDAPADDDDNIPF